MTPETQPKSLASSTPVPEAFASARESPFLRAPEEVRTIYRVTMAAAALPLIGGLVWFGWRAGIVTAIAVATCAVTERLYYRVSRAPALLGRSHAYLTGLLLALTLPAACPWYVPLVGGVFAILIGKAVFGGVGHFLWQPALVGRLAVGVFFASSLNPDLWPMLARGKLVWGDVTDAQSVDQFRQWDGQPAPPGYDAMKVPTPASILAGLTRAEPPRFSALAYLPDANDLPPRPRPTAMSQLPPIEEMLLGPRGGGIGETSILLIVLGGLYLVYRNYVTWQLPAAMLASAALVAMAAPIRLAGAGGPAVTVWWPALSADGEVGVLYVCYQLCAGGLVLAAFFLAPEMTSRPVTARGQVVFGALAGATAMLLQLYFDSPIPACLAVLAFNTLTPVIEAVFRPRVLGTSRLPWRRRV